MTLKVIAGAISTMTCTALTRLNTLFLTRTRISIRASKNSNLRALSFQMGPFDMECSMVQSAIRSFSMARGSPSGLALSHRQSLMSTPFEEHSQRSRSCCLWLQKPIGAVPRPRSGGFDISIRTSRRLKQMSNLSLNLVHFVRWTRQSCALSVNVKRLTDKLPRCR